MNVDADDDAHCVACAHFARRSAFFRLGEKKPDRVEQERSRAASGIKDLLFERRRNRLPRHFRGQPSGGVILAETVALLAINQRLVQCLHHVTLDLSKAEAADMGHNTSDEFRAFRVGDDPVEEIALDRAVDACVRQSRPRKKSSRLVLVQPEDGEGDAFGDNDEIGVLKPQRVGFYVVAVDNFEKLRPELAEP